MSPLALLVPCEALCINGGRVGEFGEENMLAIGSGVLGESRPPSLEAVENGEEGNFADVGEPEEEIDEYEFDERSEGAVYEIMFVVDINATGADIFDVLTELRLPLLLGPFLVSVRPTAMVVATIVRNKDCNCWSRWC